MPIRTASAVWEGDLKGGKGKMKMATGAYEGPYTFSSRFEEGPGTNPEELIAAAHAGCFSMAFSNGLAKAGYTPKRVSTTAKVHLEGGKITTIELISEADVPGIDEKKFLEIGKDAKKNCPVSQLVTGATIKLQATLVP